MTKKIIIFFSLLTLLVPAVSFAVEDLRGLVDELINLVNSVIPLLFSIVLVGFIWGVIKYLFSADVTKLKDARKYIVFSVIAIAVMMSIWSIALFLKNSLFPNAPTQFTPSSTGGSSSGTQAQRDLEGKPCTLPDGTQAVWERVGNHTFCMESNPKAPGGSQYNPNQDLDGKPCTLSNGQKGVWEVNGAYTFCVAK
jgi:hypothetical protein